MTQTAALNYEDPKITAWQLRVGMEIHIQLQTKSKMFCGCKNDPFHSQPNANICPICYGLPGTLPLINKEAVSMAVKLGQALNGQIAKQSFWARKNYFYPDLPKGYQISQSSAPLVQAAKLTLEGKTYRINRIHLEEDAGKLLHPQGPNRAQAKSSVSLVDFNRAGVPLMEIVTEPDFDSTESAKRFCQELQAIVRHLDLSQADMEKGEMRCEANISVSPPSANRKPQNEALGTKVEIKNLNSFRSVERAIKFEFDRQVNRLKAGETIVQETRTWDEVKGETVGMRAKETSADYRYFPEPDLPTVNIIPQLHPDSLLPESRRRRLVDRGVDAHLAEVLVKRGIDELVLSIDPPKIQAVAKLLVEQPNFPQLSAPLLSLLVGWQKSAGWNKATTMSAAKELSSGKTPELVRQRFVLVDDLMTLAEQAIIDHPAAVADYRAGKETALNFLVGQLLKKTGGRGHLDQIRRALKDRLAN